MAGNRRNANPPPPPQPSIQDLIASQNQLMQTLMQFIQHQPAGGPQPVQAPARDKRGEFLKGRPPVFNHAADPLDADDWLRAVERQLNIAQCNDQEKVLYASAQLQRAAQDWWESFQYGRPNNAPAITWQEFCENFRSYHIPEGLIELKQAEFRSLKQGRMSVPEFRDHFVQLSRYAPDDVANDKDKQRLFLKGLHDRLQLQLMTTTYPNFQELVNRAIVIDNKRQEMADNKRKKQGQTFTRNNRSRPNAQQRNFQQRHQGPSNQWNRNQNQSRSQSPPQQQKTPTQTPQQATPSKTPNRTNTFGTPIKCFACGESGHLSYHCPKKQNQQTPQSSNQKGRHQQSSNQGSVNHVSAETA